MNAVADHAPGGHRDTGERDLPPVTQLAMLSLALIVAGGIYLASHIPNHVSLGPAIALLGTSAALLAINLLLLYRVKDFPWGRFFAVAKWAMLAYTIIAGMIEYAFLRDELKGGPLVVLTLSLVVFAVHVPVLIGFTVARFYDPAEQAQAGSV
ncbi:MAG TPA: hypothetical protein VHU13_05045 [Solirubrobacteraceae bacterium]|jgi:hypothetical protein|nr:hypothetical protein [Solirubrobacteraceae bacterium]